MKNKNALKLGIFSDLHTGHRAGLTPPEYQSGERKHVLRQSEKWEWFVAKVKEAGPFDICIWLGDLVDGLGVRNHSETIIGDLNRQILASKDCVDAVGCKNNLFVYGTCVHVSTKDGLEIEKEVAQLVNGIENPKIFGQVWFDFGGYTIDCRHAPAGKSMVPHTRGNPIQRERMSNEQWFLDGSQELSGIYLRGHLHYCFTAGSPGRWQGYIVPALQSPDTKYGRILSNVVNCGFSTLETADGSWPTFKFYEAPKCRNKILKF